MYKNGGLHLLILSLFLIIFKIQIRTALNSHFTMPIGHNTRHSSRLSARMPRQLKNLQPSQRKLPFAELQGDIPDEGHQEAFELLYSEINKFLKDEICKKAANTKSSLWKLKHPKEFLSFARMVARPGADGEWEKLLRSRPYRCVLLSGVMMMMLEKHVFSDLLFGAGPEHAELLRMEDSSMINVEGITLLELLILDAILANIDVQSIGFRRTALRADTNRVYLEATGGVPPLFWKRVDKITAQIVTLLSPLSAALGEDAPSSSSYQALHDIVALAGWLNLAIRLSPKITVLNGSNLERHIDTIISALEKTRRLLQRFMETSGILEAAHAS